MSKSVKRFMMLACILLPTTMWGATVTWSEGGFSFSADNTKTEATVTSTSNNGAIVIPSTAVNNDKTYTVTAIETWFTKAKYQDITSVTIPATVKTIATGAFGLAENITEMKVESGSQNFTAVDGVLYSKDMTTLVYWPAKKTVGDYTIPSTIKTLSGDAFSNNQTITSVVIPASVTTIANGATTQGRPVGAFANCTNLASVTFDPASTLATIGSFAFDNCKNLTTLNWASSIKNIGSYAFKECDKLDVELPPYLETMDNNAFESCDAMTTVIFPSTMKRLSSSAFNACYKITKVVIPDDCAVATVPSSCFRLNYQLTEVQLSDKITSIQNGAFESCTHLTTIDLSDNLTTIGSTAFYSNSALENVTFHDKLTTIGNGAFASCKKLKDINLPQSLTSIGICAFRDVPAETITIPAGVTSIGGGAFARTANMKEFVVAEGNTAYVTVEGVLFTKDMKTLMAYPAASTRNVAYTVPAGVTTIQEGAFTDAVLTHITLPSTLETIYNGAFAHNQKLTELTIPASVTAIGKTNSSEYFTLKNENMILDTKVASLYLLNATTPPVIQTDKNAEYVTPNRNNSSTRPQFPTVYVKKSAYDSGVYQNANLWSKMASVMAYEIPVTLPASGLKTMGRDFDVDLSASDLTAYLAVSADVAGNVGTANMEAVNVSGHDAGKYVPSRTGQHTVNGVSYENYIGVILKGNGGASATYRIGEDDDATTSQTNYLVAATDETKVKMSETKNGVAYTNLGLNSGQFKYFKADGTLAYNKCYLSMPASIVGTYGNASGAKAFRMLFMDPSTTGISEAQTNMPSADDGAWYTLQGVRTEHPQHGIFIHNGKKVIIK